MNLNLMKFNLSCVVYLTCLVSLYAQTRYDINLMSEGRLRESIVVKPSSPPPIGGYPIVIMLHGTNQNGEENFITVFPTSLRWCYVDDSVETHGLRWVNGQVTDVPCLGPPQNYISDVNFLKLLAKKIADTFPVNSAMIFASGFSNGSGMIHKLAMDAGDVFAACAGSGSFLPRGDSLKPIFRIPVWAMIGTKDDKSIRPPFTEIPFGGDSVLQYFYNPLNRMLVCQGVTQNFIKFETAITHSYDFKESISGDTGQLYRFTIVNDMFHVYPNGMNFRLEAAKLFWEFFKSSVVVKNSDHSKLIPTASVFPNPSSEIVQISIPEYHGNYLWKLQDASGKIRSSGIHNNTSELLIKKSEAGIGLFILTLQTDHQVYSNKIIFK